MTLVRCLLACSFLLLAGCGPQRDSGAPHAPQTASPIAFRDVTAQAGITWARSNGAFGQYWMPETMGGGGAFIDFDGDGLLDILLVNGDWWPGHPLKGQRPTLALYRNNGDGTFTDVTKQVGLDISIQGMGVAVGDYDNDGWDDLFITGVGKSLLLHNEATAPGNPKSRIQHPKSGQNSPLAVHRLFRDVTTQSGIQLSSWSTGAAWLDYDNDGRLDLFVCSYVKWTPETDIFCGSAGQKSYCRPQEYSGQSCRLFHNDGGGRFRDVTRQAGIWNEGAKALGVCVVDLDDDGYADLIVANDMEPNFVFRNDGHGGFQESGFASGISVDESGHSRAGMGIDSADVLADGTQALAVGNFSYEGVAFYPLSGQQPYAERSRQSGLYTASYPFVTFGLAFADFDNDGRPDLCITNGHIEQSVSRTSPGQTYAQPCVLFRNLGGGRFADVSRMAGDAITRPLVGRGLCRGDYDNDGKPDLLLVPSIGPPRLLHNESRTDGHWLTLDMRGTTSNRDGYGAKVTVEAGGTKQTAWCRSGSSYLSAQDRRLHFGLGAAVQADTVTIRWPGGQTQKFTGVSADRFYRIRQGAASPEALGAPAK